jgi:hypothetical protein
MAEPLKTTSDLMAAKEAVARLDGELAARRARTDRGVMWKAVPRRAGGSSPSRNVAAAHRVIAETPRINHDGPDKTTLTRAIKISASRRDDGGYLSRNGTCVTASQRCAPARRAATVLCRCAS